MPLSPRISLWSRLLWLLTAACVVLASSTARAQTPAPARTPAAPTPAKPGPTLPPLPAKKPIETVGPTATSPQRNDQQLPATARTPTGDVPLGGQSLRAKAALPPLRWDPSWSRFGVGDAVVTGFFGALGLTATIIRPIRENRRSGGILFDDDARDAIRIGNASGRFSARDASDSILSLLITSPFFIDSLGAAWWFRGNADVARQMAGINLEAMAITTGLQGITNVLAARERPYGQDCGTEIQSDTVDCVRARRYRSFFSGHAAQAFTAANLMCYHHMKLRLFGNGPADAIYCASALAAAASVATLRMAGDMHYASDVLVGAGVGTLVGLGVPFLHYHGGLPTLELSKSSQKERRSVSVVPAGMGVSLVGQF